MNCAIIFLFSRKNGFARSLTWYDKELMDDTPLFMLEILKIISDK